MTFITETRHAAGFLVSEDEPGRRSRSQVTLKQQSSILQAGTVLGVYGPSTGAPVYAATGGNTGNFTCGTVTESAGAIVGDYKIEFIAATVFLVINPNGVVLGEGVVGAAFSGGGIGFTLSAGATPAVAGDDAKITVSANADKDKVAPLSLTATNGLQNAVSILLNEIDATAADTKVTVIDSAAEVNGSELVYPAGATTNQKAAIALQLATFGIKVR